MLFHLLYPLADQWPLLNLVRYITFRGMVSLLVALALSFLVAPGLIRALRAKQIGQVVRDDGPSSHLSKAGTPTMGGLLLLFGVLVPTLLLMDWSNPLMWALLILFAGYGILGFIDDYAKITKRSSAGLSSRAKLFWQVLIALAALLLQRYTSGGDASVLTIPFFKEASIDLGLWSIPFGTLVIVGASNAVNLTDGLDGLAIGAVMIAAGCFAILSYVSGHIGLASYLQFPYIQGAGELAIFAAAIVGAGLGFLWYNAYPAQIFMGDIGSLPLGGALGGLAVFSKHELLLALIGGVFVAEALSVMAQVFSFKTTGRRVLRMAPLHHHFELLGWPEPKVIVRFWIVAIILALIGLLSLKVR